MGCGFILFMIQVLTARIVTITLSLADILYWLDLVIFHLAFFNKPHNGFRFQAQSVEYKIITSFPFSL